MSHQLTLLTHRRFWPLFWAQFLGAFNDNFLKNAIVIMVAYQGLSVWGLSPDAMGTFAPALFIAPYFLLSAMAGQLADKYAKSTMMRKVKLAEIALALLAAVGFYFGQAQLLLAVLFFLGVQATFFGPIKYAILPQLLSDDELVTGNALVEMGTNLAILLGTIAGGVLVSVGGVGPALVSAGLIALALLGWISSLFVEPTPAADPQLVVDTNPVLSTIAICRDAIATPSIFRAILGVSWFWLFGFSLLGLFIPYATGVLHAGEHVVTLFLALFSIGVAAGSLLCEKLSFDRLELGLVPFGSIGMSLFTADLAWAWGAGIPLAGAPGLTIPEFLVHPGGLRIAADLLLLSLFSGFFIVPLYTFIQVRAEAASLSRVIAANNIINAVFIVAWAGIQIALLSVFHVTQMFVVLAILNALVALYIYSVIPEFFLRFAAYLLTHLLYRVRAVGPTNIPEEGAAVLVCNHVSFIDWLLIAAVVKRPVRFVMHQDFANIPILKYLIRQAKVIPISSAKEDPEMLQVAMDRIADELAAGELVCIFPEGKITVDGTMSPFRPGIEKIIARTPVPVVPLALQGLWGSFFSRKDGRAMSHPFRRVWSHVGLAIGVPVPPTQANADFLHAAVAELRADKP